MTDVKETKLLKEPHYSKVAHENDMWEPTWVVQRFSNFMMCNHASCGEIAVISGSVHVEEYYYLDDMGEEAQSFGDVFFPEYVFLRTAVEIMLTEQSIPRYNKSQKGAKRIHINLHNRIVMLGKKNSDAAECLMAVKWLGNHGSHAEGELGRDDIFDAADLIEHASNLLYAKNTHLIKKAKKINKKKGPVKKMA
ncbi:MAG: DUF4145 domain-containing protein [Alphaproteobacteria bacterium]|nr:DUF4145 domain-containing protein [Alphaproteobacteria bacterium]